MKFGFDLDNTISDAPEFFALLSCAAIAAGNEIHIITAREPGDVMRKMVESELLKYGVKWTHIEITSDKHDYILSQGITVYFDDTDEFFHKLPPEITIFKIREPGNFCFDTHRWLYGDHTGDNVHETNAERNDRLKRLEVEAKNVPNSWISERSGKFWQCLVRVIAIDENDSVWVAIPEWSYSKATRLDMSFFPKEMQSQLHVGYRFFAKVNSDAENIRDLVVTEPELAEDLNSNV